MKVAIFIILTTSLLVAKDLSFRQILTLKMVKNVALSHPNKRGKTFEDTMMAICLSETGCGKTNFGDKQLLRRGIKKASYGIMQVRLQTARFVAKKYSLIEAQLLDDISLIEKLMNDDLFNVKIATLYVDWLSDHSKSYFETVSRYNGGKVNYPYFNKIKKNKRFLSRFKL